MKDFRNNTTAEHDSEVDPMIEAIFYCSDEGLSDLIRSNFGDEREFIDRATNVVDQALAAFDERNKSLRLNTKSSAEVIDIRSGIVMPAAEASLDDAFGQSYWKKMAAVIGGSLLVVSAGMLALSFFLIAPIAEDFADRFLSSKEYEERVPVQTNLASRGDSLRIPGSDRGRNRGIGRIFFVANFLKLKTLGDDNIANADDFRGTTSLYESPRLIMGAIETGARRVNTSVIAAPFDDDIYALTFRNEIQTGAQASRLKTWTVIPPRIGYAPEGPSVRD